LNIGLRTPDDVPSFAVWFLDEDAAAADFIDGLWAREKRSDVARGILDCSGFERCKKMQNYLIRTESHARGRLLFRRLGKSWTSFKTKYHVQETIGKFKDFGCALGLPFSELARTNHRQAPLRSSDRRKLKQRVTQTFSLDPDVGEDLVPDGLLSVKFKTHTHDPGVS